ncbi:MAG: hypothetical protein RIR09_883 [Pseudomonadota bacterium]|jgi:hypothetical protein
MKLNLVPARQGTLWVKLGIQTFFRQPLALVGLFFMFLAVISIVNLVPVVGNILAMTLLPAATLGLMAAGREATDGKFPMPSVLLSGFRAGRKELVAMLTLGALYALSIVVVLGLSALIDGGQFAKLYLGGASMTAETLKEADFQWAVMFSSALFIPVSLLFWHAPALVHWHGEPPIKSLFFSFVACMRNFGAMTVYSLTWLGVFVLVSIAVSLIAALTGSVELVATLMYPAAMVLAAMFFTSLYFTFRDNFSTIVEATP